PGRRRRVPPSVTHLPALGPVLPALCGSRAEPARGREPHADPAAAPPRPHPLGPRVPRHPRGAAGRPPRVPRLPPRRRPPGGRSRRPPVLPGLPGARHPCSRPTQPGDRGGLMLHEDQGSARYEISYRTVIHYDDVVRGSQSALRACPMSDDYQVVLAYDVSVHPQARVLPHTDYWGTRVDSFGVREPHVAIEIVASSSVE